MTESTCIPGLDHLSTQHPTRPPRALRPPQRARRLRHRLRRQHQRPKSHDIIEKGIQVLINLTHRGACGCDPETGDGAGILIQIPHKFFARECAALGFTLPARANTASA